MVKDHAFAKTLKKPNPTRHPVRVLRAGDLGTSPSGGKFFAIKVRVFGEVHDLLPVSNPDLVTVVDTADHGYEFIIDGKRYSQDEVPLSDRA